MAEPRGSIPPGRSIFNQEINMKNSTTFKLSKRSKTITALSKFTNQVQRDAFRRMMIEAEQVTAQRSREKRSADNSAE